MTPTTRAPPLRLHLSIDDVTHCLRELAERPHLTPWTQPTFAYLRALHERSGVVVSLYVFERDASWRLGATPDRHRAAFEAASGWLRFGFHGRDAASDYGSDGVSVERAATDYRTFAAEVRRFAGASAIDRVPRVHRFRGRRAIVRAWRTAEDGVLGLLCADDERPEVYHLDATLRTRLRDDGAAFDAREGVHLVPSLRRLEGHVGDVGPQLELAASTQGARAGVPICLFTHESDVSDPHVRRRVDSALRWARRRGATHAFPADVLGEPQVPASRSAS